ncbi:sphingosine N-acyltransferase LAC1 [Saccharomyces eubayanus]|uniref:sphingosine N-acyltransferase LAC1 n=1 Tax=Saccharomyces eubayanus TaxID=1080349 RepID=UPI0006BEFABC|nr:LAC1-like protein [Saccharomyces eubayanus]KOG98310.1 LAC1-like protein [Saccharomyces eubayanus]
MSNLMQKSSNNNLKVRSRPRRKSSIGKIDLGDTVPSLGTMFETKESKTAAKKRMQRLSEVSKNDSDLVKKIWFSFREISYRHAWIAPLLILIAVYSAYFTSGNTTKTNVLHRFVAVSYQVGDTDVYGKGIKDLCFVFYYMIFFTFLREFLMDVVIKPFAVSLHVTSRHRIKRMMEQIYAIFYTGFSGPFGLYCMYHSNVWFFDTKAMYRTYPDFTNPFLFKVFYLGQAAFWAQQACILVLQLEKPRKDHNELTFHHIVTLLLIWSSYVFHFTKMGLPIYITMDLSDFLLSLSKTLNYLDSVFAPFSFCIFVVSWIYLRHYINLKILWSVLTQFRTEGNYVLNFATQQYKCWISLPIVFVLIGALQLVNLYWLFLIFRVLYRILWRGVLIDDRSDSESEEESDESATTPTDSTPTKKVI